MKYIHCLCLTICVCLSACAPRSPNDAKAIQGNWSPASAELGGKPMPDAVLKTIRLKLANGSYEATVAGEADKGTYTLEATAKPKRMNIVGTDGPNKGKNFPAIYELSGDTLRICYDLSGANYPAELQSVAGTKLFLVTYNRKAD